MLIDEYQDIDSQQYEMITHIASEAGRDEDHYATILAVGDDDQAIYGFRGANIEFIQRYREDVDARIHCLVENYRSTANIISTSNSLISHNEDRMKKRSSYTDRQGT
ncbi:MAG: UvrD-helicase domain-containing protein [Acidimicrobiaceae bacterium]|nr:UvrD-helicase domain-containing protein [Acidimicrobiaceae bacterium]